MYILQGKAYVPMSEQVSIVMDEFRATLSAALEVIIWILERLEKNKKECV